MLGQSHLSIFSVPRGRYREDGRKRPALRHKCGPACGKSSPRGSSWALLAPRGGSGATNPNKPRDGAANSGLVEGHLNPCIPVVWLWPFGSTTQPFISAWLLKSKGGFLKLRLLLMRLKGANGVLAAPTWLRNVVPQRPVLNPGLHFSPEESSKRQATISV